MSYSGSSLLLEDGMIVCYSDYLDGASDIIVIRLDSEGIEINRTILDGDSKDLYDPRMVDDHNGTIFLTWMEAVDPPERSRITDYPTSCLMIQTINEQLESVGPFETPTMIMEFENPGFSTSSYFHNGSLYLFNYLEGNKNDKDVIGDFTNTSILNIDLEPTSNEDDDHSIFASLIRVEMDGTKSLLFMEGEVDHVDIFFTDDDVPFPVDIFFFSNTPDHGTFFKKLTFNFIDIKV